MPGTATWVCGARIHVCFRLSSRKGSIVGFFQGSLRGGGGGKGGHGRGEEKKWRQTTRSTIEVAHFPLTCFHIDGVP